MYEFKTKTSKYICLESPGNTFDIYNTTNDAFMFRTSYKMKSVYKNFLIFASPSHIIIFNEEERQESKNTSYFISHMSNNYEIGELNKKEARDELQRKIERTDRRIKTRAFGSKLIINENALYDFETHKIERRLNSFERFKILNTELLFIDNKDILSLKGNLNDYMFEILNIKNNSSKNIRFYARFGKLIKKSMFMKYMDKTIDEYISKKVIKMFFEKQKNIYALSKFFKKNESIIYDIYANSKYKNIFINLINLFNKEQIEIKRSKYETIYDPFVCKYLNKNKRRKYKTNKNNRIFQEVFKNNLSHNFLEKFLEEFKNPVKKDNVIFKKPFLLVNYLPSDKEKEILSILFNTPFLVETIHLFKTEDLKLHCYEFEDQEIFKRKTDEMFNVSMAECFGRSLFYFNSGKGKFKNFFITNIESNEKRNLNEIFFEITHKFSFNISVCNFLAEKLNRNKLFKFSKIYYEIMQKKNMNNAGLIFAYGLKGILHEVFNQTNELIMILEEESFFSNIFLLSFAISLFNSGISFNINLLIKYALKYSQNTNSDRRIMGIQTLSFLQSQITDPIKKEYNMKKILEETKRKGTFKQIVSKEENLLGNKIARKCYFTKSYNLLCIYALALSNLNSSSLFNLIEDPLAYLLINGINFFNSARIDVVMFCKRFSKGFVFKKFENLETIEKLCTPEFQFYYTFLINCVTLNKTIKECFSEIEDFIKEQEFIKSINLYYHISALSLYVGIKSLQTEENNTKTFSSLLDLILKVEKKIKNIHTKKVLGFLLLSIVLMSDTNTDVLRIIRRRIKLCTNEPKEQSFIISSVKTIKREFTNIFSESSSYGELYFLYALLGLHTKNLTKTVKVKPDNLFIYSLLNSFPIDWSLNEKDSFNVNKYFLFLKPDLFNLFNEKKLMLVDTSLRVVKSNLKESFCTFKIGRFVLTRFALSRFYTSGSPLKRKVVTDVLLDYFKNQEVKTNEEDDLEDFKLSLMNNVFNRRI